MNIYFIRHFKTKGNLEKRYVGTTDEPILECEQSIAKAITNATVTGDSIARITENESIQSLDDTEKIIKNELTQLLDNRYKFDDIVRFRELNSVEIVYASPMLRCIQTAKLLFFNTPIEQVSDFRECDFGDFEYLNYKELSDNILYQDWLDSNGTLTFPNGESRGDFQGRCVKAFKRVIDEAIKSSRKNIALVVHGGTIMSILEKYALPHRDYYDYQIKNGECVYTVLDIKDTKSQNLDICLKIV